MNDWTRIEAELLALTTSSQANLQRAWRDSADARAWLDANGVDAAKVSEPDIRRFINDVTPTTGSRDPRKRRWAFNLIVDAARAVAPPRAKVAGSLAARIDAVPARSPLGKAISRVLAGAKNEYDRQVWPTCIGLFLAWCDEKQIDPMDLWEGHLTVYRRELSASGRRSIGEYARVAKRLLEEIQNA